MATCNVKTNTVRHMKTKGFLDENFIVRDPLFYAENARLSNLAREKYYVQNRKSLFFTHSLDNEQIKATPNEDMFRELQDRKDNPDDYRGSTTMELTDEEISQITTPNEENIVYKISKLEDNIVTDTYRAAFNNDPVGSLQEIYQQAISSPEERKGAANTVGEEMVQLAESHFGNLQDSLKQEIGKPITIKTSQLDVAHKPFEHTIFRGKKKVGFVITESDEGEYLSVVSAEINQPGEGIGTQAYQQIGQEAEYKGLQLRSDRLDRMNPASVGLWEKLVRIKKALKIGNHYYYGDIVPANNLPPIIPKC